jgi:glycosyltransferase involved in cell wall biosynthesis
MGEICFIFERMERDESLRILHIASWYPSWVHDSLGNFIQRHVAAVATKHECELWHASPVSGESPLLGVSEVVEADGFVERIVYPKATKPGVRAVTRALMNLVPGEDIAMPDIVHLHVAFPGGRAARILAERWDVPLIVTEHWTAYHDSQHIPLWRRIAMRKTASSTSTFCPVTDQLGEKMREFKMVNSQGNEEYITVPNVVDTDKFSLGERKREKNGEMKLLHVSSLEEAQKNITGILHTIAHLKASKPDFEFSITFVGGSDPERLTKVRKYAANLNLTAPRVLFTGPKNSEVVAELMRAADAVVLFSRKENFPCVIAEAWATGKPVITTDVGGIAEHMDESRGMLIKSGDEGELATAILDLDKEWDAEGIRQYAVDKFSVEAVADAFDRVYKNALGGSDDGE